MHTQRNMNLVQYQETGPQLQCPSQGLQFDVVGPSYWIRTIHNVKSWKECAKNCRANVKMRRGNVCNYWSWDENINKCLVMVNARKVIHRTHDVNKFKHWFSGDRTCGLYGCQSNHECRLKDQNKPICTDGRCIRGLLSKQCILYGG